MEFVSGLGLIGVIAVLVIAVMLILAPLKLFSIDATLKKIFKELQDRKIQ